MFDEPEHTLDTYCDGDALLHGEHTVSAHALHADEMYRPLGHVLHVEEHALALPVEVEYVPAAHDVQLVEPAEVEYVPIGHGKQFDEFDAPIKVEYVPAGHRVQDVAPAADHVPAGHAISTPSTE